MNNVFEILGFAKLGHGFRVSAKNIMSMDQREKVKTAANDLKALTESMEAADEKPEQDLIEKAYAKFEKYCRGGRVDLTGREIRMVTYAMDRVKTPKAMSKLISLMDSKWRSRYLLGMLNYLLSSWISADNNVRESLSLYFVQRLQTYNGKRENLCTLKKNALYFEESGPELLGLKLARQDKTVKDITKSALFCVCQTFFGMKSTHLEFEYFSRVIIAYFEKTTDSSLNLLTEVLNIHNFPLTSKLLLPNLIISVSNGSIQADKVKLKRLALKHIGDPAIKAHWNILSASVEVKNNIERARQILQEWVKIEFISAFFEKLVDDPARKRYWIGRASLIRDFKIYTTKFVYQMILERDPNLSGCLDSNVIPLRLESMEKKAALVFDIGKWYIIEFSDVGSIYIYKKGGINSRGIEEDHITYFRELKHPNLMNMNAAMMIVYEEGKIIHNKNWEERMDDWFKSYGIL